MPRPFAPRVRWRTVSSEARRAPSAIAADSRCEYEGGSNCAQAILTAFRGDTQLVGLEHYMGSGFGGGMGNTGCLCGALGGATVVLGAYVDSLALEPVASRVLAEQLTAELTVRFKGHYQSTCCRVIKRHHAEGSNEWLTHCAGLVEQTAAITESLIDEHRATLRERGVRGVGGLPRFAARDTMNAARTVASGVVAGLGAGVGAWAIAPAAVWMVLVGGLLGALAGAARVWGGPALRRGARGAQLAGPLGALVAMAVVLARGVTPYLGAVTSPAVGGWRTAAITLAALAALVLATVRTFEYVRTR